jgi:hypothetical protein
MVYTGNNPNITSYITIPAYQDLAKYQNMLAQGFDYTDFSSANSSSYTSVVVEISAVAFPRELYAVIFAPANYASTNKWGWYQRDFEIEYLPDENIKGTYYEIPQFRSKDILNNTILPLEFNTTLESETINEIEYE